MYYILSTYLYLMNNNRAWKTYEFLTSESTIILLYTDPRTKYPIIPVESQ